MLDRQYLLAIDPGTTASGVCIIRKCDMKPLEVAKIPNEEVFNWFVRKMSDLELHYMDFDFCIERMQGNGMPVSSEVFITCEWIGIFTHHFASSMGLRNKVAFNPYIYRRDEYRTLCGNLYSHNDKGVKASLVDRFAYGKPNHGKGNKKDKGWFYGFYADTWSAYAVAVTFVDKENLRA